MREKKRFVIFLNVRKKKYENSLSNFFLPFTFVYRPWFALKFERSSNNLIGFQWRDCKELTQSKIEKKTFTLLDDFTMRLNQFSLIILNRRELPLYCLSYKFSITVIVLEIRWIFRDRQSHQFPQCLRQEKEMKREREKPTKTRLDRLFSLLSA